VATGSGSGEWQSPLLRRIYVVAGNYREFMIWCSDNHLSRNDPRLHYIQDFTHLMGRYIEESMGDRVVLYGTYEGRMDWPEMVEELRARWKS
jgi:hypothetical protein